MQYTSDYKSLYHINDDITYYPINNEDLHEHYSQTEIDYARIMMTVKGVPSLDAWNLLDSEHCEFTIKVEKSSAGDLVPLAEEVTYPEDVTHLKLMDEDRMTDIITFSNQRDGYIKIYPFPTEYYDGYYTHEPIDNFAQEFIDTAYTEYIEPFEPYNVADLIGRVNFEFE